MARRDQGLLNDLEYVPWWISVIFAVITYVGLKSINPAILAGIPMFDGLDKTLPLLCLASRAVRSVVQPV